MSNLRITFRLRVPVCLNHPWLHLDGLLAHLALRRRMGSEYYLLPTFRVEDISGILDGILDFRDGVPCASVSVMGNQPAFTISYFKRFERRHSDSLRKRIIDQGSGSLREWRLTAVYVPVDEIVFFARGDAERIRDLLDEVVALGNDYRVGWGELHSPPQIEEIPEDCSIIWNGVAMRPIPVDRLGYSSEVVSLAWRPPYWARENVAPCAPPGAQVRWKE